MTEKNPLKDHDYLVLVLARWLERNDFLVAANLKDHTKPPSIAGHRPDVYAKQADRVVIGEAELCGRLSDPETNERWKALVVELTASSSRSTCELHIIVPSQCLEEARQQAAGMGITAVFHTEKLADQPGLTGEQD
jgi:hypothetical protein